MGRGRRCERRARSKKKETIEERGGAGVREKDEEDDV